MFCVIPVNIVLHLLHCYIFRHKILYENVQQWRYFNTCSYPCLFFLSEHEIHTKSMLVTFHATVSTSVHTHLSIKFVILLNLANFGMNCLCSTLFAEDILVTNHKRPKSVFKSWIWNTHKMWCNMSTGYFLEPLVRASLWCH